jgi:hypothetical protein
MEHPLITDVGTLSLDDLGTRVNDLQKKLAIAQQGGNGYLCHQLRMALETYHSAYQRKVKENLNDKNFSDKIHIE